MFWIKERVLPKFCRTIAEVAEVLPKLSKKENKGKWGECTATNEHIGEIAAVSPQKRQCKFGSYYPARTFVKPLPRQYATTLHASRATEQAEADRVR
ncbi:MAG: hypothetical protein FWD60_08280 [Candidatus Azobacteroides sp.]|nr:hypothetical protein [Candidatus Azobacteroides sp.]